MRFHAQRIGWLWIGVLGLVGAAGAQQVDVSLALAYSSFVTGEPVLAQVEVLNATRDLIEIGTPNAKDALIVEVSKGGGYNEMVPFSSDPLVGAVTLKPGESFQHKVELDKWYALTEEGKYMARVVVVHGGMRYESTKRSFDVVPGLPIKEAVQMFVNRPNQKRLFKLVHWSRNQTDRLFLRIEDEPGNKVWDSIDLGVLLRTTEPKIDLSPEGEVTVVHRSTQDAFIRTLIWSLPDHVDVQERSQLLDPEISASQRVRSLYGEMSGDKKEEKKSWWKFW